MNRIILGASNSGCGKTTITCGLLTALMARDLKTMSFKCGPDYIDPMFHSKVIGVPSKNLDTFFTSPSLTRALLADAAKNADISLIEGVMGFYDGIGGITDKASTFELAEITDTPVLLLLLAKGMSYSLLPIIKGYLSFRRNSHIRGILLNQISPMLYPRIKSQIETELHIKVYGYIPEQKDFVLENRHLGLITPDEIENIREKLRIFAGSLEKTIDIDAILALAKTAPELTETLPKIEPLPTPPVIAVARDKAFSFYYEDNLNLLKRFGAKLVFFSPLNDKEIPKLADALLLGGGYPELYAKELSENITMRKSIFSVLSKGMPCLAECGGFMYLHQTLEDINGIRYPMAGYFPYKSYKTGGLVRFGYGIYTCQENSSLCKEGTIIKGHEFHHWDSNGCGSDFIGEKPYGPNKYMCIHNQDNIVAGYPHFYYYSNIEFVYQFLQAAAKLKK